MASLKADSVKNGHAQEEGVGFAPQQQQLDRALSGGSAGSQSDEQLVTAETWPEYQPAYIPVREPTQGTSADEIPNPESNIGAQLQHICNDPPVTLQQQLAAAQRDLAAAKELAETRAEEIELLKNAAGPYPPPWPLGMPPGMMDFMGYMPPFQSPLPLPPGMPQQDEVRDDRTTVMWQGIPNNCKRDDLLKVMDDKDFKGRYDFVYLPMDFVRKAALGYAFVNLVTHEEANKFYEAFQDFKGWKFRSEKPSVVEWSEKTQGFDKNVERYRNSPVMHPDSPDDGRPLIFKDGIREPFPAPNRKLQPVHQKECRR